jgi:gamma-glutamyltranspeptidase/glutathione hydrolase
MAADAVIAAPHYLASLSGARVLADGGSAVDAAIAANMVMAVVWPHMCGVGGDLFAQVWDGHQLSALNSSGPAGGAMTVDAYRERGLASVPTRGPYAVTVPGAVAGWSALHHRYGRLEPERLVRDAVHYARKGFAVSPRLAAVIRAEATLLSADENPAAAVFLARGEPPAPGTRLRQLDLADTLETIGRIGPSAVYGGEIGARIVAGLRVRGSLLCDADLAEFGPEWVEPIQTSYRGLSVAQLPPNSQGCVLLELLNMLAGADLEQLGEGSSELIHQLVERKKLAFADRDQYVADPRYASVPTATLIDPEFGRRRARLVDGTAGAVAAARATADGDTIYLCAADRDGMVVSLIQSLFAAWGSGVMAPGTGVMLHNRGRSFALDPSHANALAPRKRPMHTLMPGFAVEHGRPSLAFGTRGGDGQAQTNLQLLTGLLDFGLPLQAAVEAPRWVHGAPSGPYQGNALVLESRYSPEVANDLRARGHDVRVTDALDDVMGTVQIIQIDQQRGCYVAAADPRGDSTALAV